jgi:hypothetical protein
VLPEPPLDAAPADDDGEADEPESVDAGVFSDALLLSEEEPAFFA